MKKIDWRMLVLTSSIFLIPLVLILIYYGQLPEVLQTHFAIDNQANGTSSKWVSLILTPMLVVMFHVFLCIVLDSTKNGQLPVVKVVKWILPILTTLIMVTTLAYNVGHQLDVRRLTIAFIAGIYLVTGNYMPKDVAGMTSPQTLLSRKRGGYLLIAGAGVLLLSLFFQPIVSVVVLFSFTTLVIVLSISIWIKYHKVSNR